MTMGRICKLYVTDEDGQKGYLRFEENNPKGKVVFVPLPPKKKTSSKPTTKKKK